MWPFTKKTGTDNSNENEKQEISSEYQENWQNYFSNVDDFPASFMVNLGLEKIAPIKEKPYLSIINIGYNEVNEDGFPSKEEFETVYKIEDTIVEALKSNKYIYVGRMISNGVITIYAYTKNTESFKEDTAKAMKQFPGYSYEFYSQEDESWSIYFDFLFPTPLQSQLISNRSLIRTMEENGDDITKPRMVDHWIDFKTEQDKNNFLEDIKDEGFNIIEQDKNNKESNPLSINIAREENVDFISADNFVINLWEKIEKNNGYYGGWGSLIQK